MKFIAGLFLILFACGAVAKELLIENREPRPDEIGYRPADVSRAAFNPPTFAWLHERRADSYILQWSSNANFAGAVTLSNLPFNTCTHHRTLAPGTYFWRYRFTTRDAETSNWSVVRSFTVDPSAAEFPMPSRAERRELIPQGHPRFWMRPEDLPRLRELAAGREAERFALLRAEADRILARPPVAEPKKPGSSRDKRNLELIENWWPNREAAVRACAEAEVVAFVYLITRKKKYGDAARARVLDLALWDPEGNTNFRLNCEAAKPLLHRISRAYDWAHDLFSPSERLAIQGAVRRRIEQAWESGEVGRGTGHLNRPLNSHGNRTWHKIGESGIVFLGEIPEAELWLDYALNKFYACYPVWSDEDGGWHEGMAYLAGYMSKAVSWLQAAEAALGIDSLKKPFFSQVGDFPLYVAPPGSPNIGFGDLSYQSRLGGWGGFMEYFIRHAGSRPGGSQAAYWRWWCEQWKMSGETGIAGFLYQANLPAPPEPRAPVDLPASKVFSGIGVASLHTSLVHSSNDVHFLFKSSPFGSQSHGHNPQNSFQLNAYGEALLSACTYRDLHGSDFHNQWVHQTIAHNAVLVNGQGQIPHSARSRGRIVASRLTPEWDYVAGDAAEAYDGRLERCVRHVVFVKPGLIVIRDELVAPAPAEFQFMLHAPAEFTIDEARGRLHVQRPTAGVDIHYLTPDRLHLRQWDGFKPAPVRRTFPNQWHVSATTPKRSRLEMLTILLPHRGNTRREPVLQRLESSSAIGLRAAENGRTVTVGFTRAGKEEGELAKVRFRGPVAVVIE